MGKRMMKITEKCKFFLNSGQKVAYFCLVFQIFGKIAYSVEHSVFRVQSMDLYLTANMTQVAQVFSG